MKAVPMRKIPVILLVTVLICGGSAGWAQTKVKTTSFTKATDGSVVSQPTQTFDSGRFGDSPAQQTFDSGRFGDVPAQQTFDSGRFGDAPITSAKDYMGVDNSIDAQEDLGTESDSYKQIRADQLKAMEEGDKTGVDQTTTGSTDGSADQKSNDICAMGSGDAADAATNTTRTQSIIEDNTGLKNVSDSCMKATQEAFKACSEGNKAAFKAAIKKGNEACKQENAQIDTPAPTPSVAAAADVPTNPVAAAQNAIQQVTNGTGKNLNLGSMMQQAGLPNLNQMMNPQNLGQLAGMALANQLGGGGSGGSKDNGTSSDYYDDVNASTPMDDLTTDQLSNLLSGKNISGQAAKDMYAYTCKNQDVTTTKNTTNSVVDGVSMTTIVQLDTCTKGTQTTTTVSKVGADGKVTAVESITQFKYNN